MKLRKRRLSVALAGVFLLCFSFAVNFGYSRSPQPTNANTANIAYSPQFNRNAEWNGSNEDTMPNSQIQNLAKNVSYEIIPKFSEDYNIQQHFALTKKLVAAGKTYGNNMKVFDYYNASFWYTRNDSSWQPYASQFKPQWYLHDTNGNPVPFNGPNGKVIGYVVDLSQPAYLKWAVDTMVDWMHQAPYKGIAFDSSNTLAGSTIRRDVADGNSPWNTIMCGSGAAVNTAGDCAKVAAWNAGLANLLAQTSAALHPLSDEVIFNGIAPSPQRVGRNLDLTNYADMAANEYFCYDAGGASTPRLTSLTDDINLMKKQATSGKKILQISNHQGVAAKKNLAPYCLAGFLMGWQPGYDYWSYHESYSDSLAGGFPELAEINLNLGNPTNSDYSQSGNVLSRSFQNGFVVLNNSDSPTSVTLPTKLIQFSNGNQGQTFNPGSVFSLPARSGAFFLNDSYLNPSVTASSGGQGVGNSIGGASKNAAGGSATVTTAPPKGVSVTTSTPLSGDLAGIISLKTTTAGDIQKIEYYLNGKLEHSTSRFPDTWKFDTTTLKNGDYILTGKYYHRDGSITTSKRTIHVMNKLSFAQRLLSVSKRALLPAIILLLIVGIIFYIVHRFHLFRPKWLYQKSPVGKSEVVSGNTTTDRLISSIVAPPAHAPGAVIKPNDKHEIT